MISVEVNNLSKRYAMFASQYSKVLKNQSSDYLFNSFLSFFRKKYYFWALKDINFKLRAGEVLGIIGPNGAGKSTLLKILSRITYPTYGEAKVLGKVVSLLEIGTGFNLELSGRENIYLKSAIMGMSRKEINKRFDEIVEFSGIEKFIDMPVKKYSSGMYTRLAFSVAAHLEADVMLVDEVLAVGDMEFQKKCLQKMNDISSQHGKTILFVSHNMNAIRSLCQSVILLKNGKIVEYGLPDKVIEQYIRKNFLKSGEIKYPQNSQKLVQIRKITILDNQNKPNSSIDIAKPFAIQIECDFKKSFNKKSYIRVNFYDINNNLIMQSLDIDTNSQFYQHRPKGKYIITFYYPANFFNEFRCKLKVECGLHSKYNPEMDRDIYLDEKDDIYFDFIKRKHFSNSFFSGKRGGYLSTRTKCEVKII